MKNALKKLSEGNARFVSGETMHDIDSISAQRIAAVKSQKPFAIILGCSDSRVPAEIIFDQGLGDLFVIRVAGNVVAPSQLGSIELAVSMFGAPLVIVLGHSNCGVIHATFDALKDPNAVISAHLETIVNRVKPAIESEFHTVCQQQHIENAVIANVHNSVATIINESSIISNKIKACELQVSGACYDLESGVVEFFDCPEI
jgi:carbonic anhydrase